jgi:hypothetical protein
MTMAANRILRDRFWPLNDHADVASQIRQSGRILSKSKIMVRMLRKEEHGRKR